MAPMRTKLTELRDELARACRAAYADRLVALAIFGSWVRGAAM
jgi:hypothetical protein